MKKICVVIPNWNGADLIAACLESLQKQSLKHHVIVVDNGSVDNSLDIIESGFPDITVIKLPVNTGFSGGVNTGIRHAIERGFEAVAVFNNDAVADKNWLEELVTEMNSDSCTGIVSPKQLRNDKKYIDSTGDFYSIWGMPFPRARNHLDKGQFNNKEELLSAPAGATLYRTKMLKEIGLFDEAYFAYYEDVDISFRAQLAGWKVIYQPRAIIYHHVSATSGKLGSFTRYHATKNFYLLFAKNMPGYLYLKYLPLFTLQAVRLFASSMLRGGGIAFIKGTLHALVLSPHIIRERRRIQKSRKVSLRYIDSMLYKHRPPKIPTL